MLIALLCLSLLPNSVSDCVGIVHFSYVQIALSIFDGGRSWFSTKLSALCLIIYMVRLNTVVAKNIYEFSLHKNQGTLLEGRTR